MRSILMLVSNKSYLLVSAAILISFIPGSSYAQEIQHAFSNSMHIPFVKLTGGAFMMGDTGKADGEAAEHPVHEVHVEAFLLSVYEITQVQFETVMGYNPSYNRGVNKPVEQVSWYDAVRFCNRLSLLDGLTPAYRIDPVEGYMLVDNPEGYRLPTEAEWEYAARAGTSTDTYAGDLKADEGKDVLLDTIAWYFIDPSTRHTRDVGLKNANRYGLKDILGNVWEWTESWYASYDTTYSSATHSENIKVLRGGAMDAFPYANRSSYRYRLHPSYTSYNIGFRVALAMSD